jgi:glycosyltransferase involved in cell wall biosynthesis
MKKKVIVKGPALSASGYGEHARFVLRALRSKEDIFDIYLQNIEWGKTAWIYEESEERTWIDSLILKTQLLFNSKQQVSFDYSLQVTIPNEFENMAEKNIGVTAGIETHKVAPLWLQKCNEMDRIIVVSEHARNGFVNTSYDLVDHNKHPVAVLRCEKPVDVVGYPVKDIEQSDTKFEFSTDFNFLSVALWGERKNMVNLIKSFVEEFREEENVGLVLKTAVVSGSTYDKLMTENMLKAILREQGEMKCKVYLLHGRLSEEEMTTLLNHEKIKCMATIAHGEGFGLPLFEAAYNGLPIVTTDWGGQLDFLYAPQKDKKGKTKKRGLFGKVTYDLKHVQKGSVWKDVIVPDSMWAFPSNNSTKTKMREVYKDYNLALSKAKKLKNFVLEEFSQERMYEKLTNCVYVPTKEEFIQFEKNAEWDSDVVEMGEL